MAGEDVEERRLPCSVRAGDAEDLGAADRQRDLVEDDGAAEVLPDTDAGKNHAIQEDRLFLPGCFLVGASAYGDGEMIVCFPFWIWKYRDAIPIDGSFVS